jgi:cyclohexanone monooxygenase
MTPADRPLLDAVVVGAGFSGMYMLHRLRSRGLQVAGIERGDDVGGTWYWNRYPGCRCDVESIEYSYQFDAELEQEWIWQERYASQPEILSYAQHVAERFQLRALIQFQRQLLRAHWDDAEQCWQLAIAPSDDARHPQPLRARFLIMATGCLSAANMPAFEGRNDYQGKTYHTGAWPQEGVDFTGQAVGVIGTGSSAIQSIPHIAAQARSLTVFQRTANYSVPARNRPADEAEVARIKASYPSFRQSNRHQFAAFGAHYPQPGGSVLEADSQTRQARFEAHWEHGGFMFGRAFNDLGASLEANEYAAEFVRSKIRSIVQDPMTAERLCPDTVFGCKRVCADTGYFETYNRPNVELVSVREQPIERLTRDGLIAGGRTFELDAIVFATGFDAMTGSLLRCDIRGQGGQPLAAAWQEGPRTYLGLMVQGFPNLFTMTGPGSPSVLANMITAGEQHAEFIDACIGWLDQHSKATIEPEPEAQDAWVRQVNTLANGTLFPTCNSWYLGANVPGKPRVFMPYPGFPGYSSTLADIVADGYRGFRTRPASR